MNDNQELDEMDKLLLEYYRRKRNNESIVPPSTKKVAQRFIKRVKMQNTMKKFSKVAVIFITIGIMTTGIVFAKDIANFIKSIFTNTTPAIETAVQNGYIQNVDMEYVYSNDVGVKLESLIIDNLNLDIAFTYKYNNTTINSIRLEDYIIMDENEDVIYDTNYSQKDKCNLVNLITRDKETLKIDNETYTESILFKFMKGKDVFKEIFININKLKVTKEDNSIDYVTGNWNFKINLNEKMLENREYEYITLNKDIIQELHATMTATGFIIQIKSIIPINLDIFDYSENFILENSINEKINPYFIENGDIDYNSNVENGMFTIYYNNISTYSDNIDELFLNLNVNGDIKKIKLTKKASN